MISKSGNIAKIFLYTPKRILSVDITQFVLIFISSANRMNVVAPVEFKEDNTYSWKVST